MCIYDFTNDMHNDVTKIPNLLYKSSIHCFTSQKLHAFTNLSVKGYSVQISCALIH